MLKIGVIGGGNMSKAIILGLLSNNNAPNAIMVSDKDTDKLIEFKSLGVNTGTNEDVLNFGDVVILAIKPNIYSVVLPECTGYDKLFISIAAGISVEFIKCFLGENARVVRVMPNTPALVNCGMTVICRDGASDADIKITQDIFSSVGITSISDQSHIDAVVGVSGSGPAYAFTLIEAMADAGVLNGLTRQDAILLAAQTVLGSAKMVLETGKHPAKLRDDVCSPGGTTIEAVKALEDLGFRSSVINAVSAATQKSESLKK